MSDLIAFHPGCCCQLQNSKYHNPSPGPLLRSGCIDVHAAAAQHEHARSHVKLPEARTCSTDLGLSQSDALKHSADQSGCCQLEGPGSFPLLDEVCQTHCCPALASHADVSKPLACAAQRAHTCSADMGLPKGNTLSHKSDVFSSMFQQHP